MSTMTHISPSRVARWTSAAPFWMSLFLLPLAWFCAVQGSWWVLLLPMATWQLFSILDAALGLASSNADPETKEEDLFWYKAITIAWAPLQFATLFGLIWYATRADHLSGPALVGLFIGVGVVTGTIGVPYAHELLHQRNKTERWMADILLSMVLYSHFRSEHLLVHHRYVGTPRDPVSARYNESFHAYFPRVVRQCLVSAFRAEKALLERQGKPWSHKSNPFWRYWALQALMLGLAAALGGWLGVGLFLVQAYMGILQLEMVNYVEHYGLTRKHLGEGRYEPVGPRHSWNSAHMASNWLLINLQRHSDHHYKPARRFPLLQTYPEDEAPQLPYGYPVMTAAAVVPRLWRRMMNHRVRKWRQMYYPEISDWEPYNKGTNPLPR